jgi:hypothetical protein
VATTAGNLPHPDADGIDRPLLSSAFLPEARGHHMAWSRARDTRRAHLWTVRAPLVDNNEVDQRLGRSFLMRADRCPVDFSRYPGLGVVRERVVHTCPEVANSLTL